VKVLLEEGVRDNEVEMIRYFIAYGGVVSKRGDKTGVTHMVHLKKLISDDETAGEKDLKHVTVDWIKDCIVHESVRN
jgi:hypothetical protein